VIPALSLAVVALAVLAWAVAAYNRLVRLRNEVATAWSDIDVQLQRRHDLVPSLVSAVQRTRARSWKR
jgi:LemA protein